MHSDLHAGRRGLNVGATKATKSIGWPVRLAKTWLSSICVIVGTFAHARRAAWHDGVSPEHPPLPAIGVADIDGVMSRTRGRPIPAGRVGAGEALTFGLVLSALSIMALGVLVNWLSAALLAFTIFFYVVVYTMWLKRWTPQNIVIGGAAGSLPPVIGWAAVSGGVSLESILLFLIIFLWTPPHFWALALFKTGDYERAGVPMMPNVAGPAATRRQIVLYSLIMAPVAVLPALMGFGGLLYLAVSVTTGLAMIWLSIQVWRRTEGKPAVKAAWSLFGFSILYLFLLFAVLLVENGLGLMWALPKVIG